MTPTADPVRPSRRLCGWLLVVSGVVFVVLAAWLIPWHWVPGGHYRHVPAAEVFTTRQIRQADAYSDTQRLLGWSSLGVSLAVSLLLGLTRLGRLLVGRLRGWWWVRVLSGAFLVLAVGEVVVLPFSLAARHRDLEFGLTRQAAASWWHDVGVSFLVDWALTGIALVVVIGLIRRLPRTWPLAVGGAAVALAFGGSFAYPLVVEPLYNSFTPMSASPLRSQIMAIAEREHVHISDVLVANASKRTTTLNAYVSGFGSSRRVVLYDNLLTHLTDREVLVVVAHELGHAHHDDVLVGTVLAAVGSVFGVALLGLLMSSGAVLRRGGVPGAGDPRAVPLLLALAAVGMLVASPLENTMSRDVEARADRASLAATHDYDAFIGMQRKLSVSSLQSPDPPAWSQFAFGTHPTALQRIGMAEALRARDPHAVRTD